MENNKINTCTTHTLRKLAGKRKLRKQWQKYKHLDLKTKLNHAIKEIKSLLLEEKNFGIQNYLKNLSAITDYSLWRATKKLKQPHKQFPPIRIPGGWARNDEEKANTFSAYLSAVYAPNPS